MGEVFHEIKRGGLLKIHTDFNRHPTMELDRRLNVLIYLNKDWEESYGGHLQLWDKDMKYCKKISSLYSIQWLYLEQLISVIMVIMIL